MSTDADMTGSGALYRLLAWLSPSFPIGAFSYSHGLEAAADAGAVCDRASLQDWVAAIVVRGSGRMDADILRDAYRAVAADDAEAFAAANARGAAYRGTAELALENTQQGEAFLSTYRAAWEKGSLETGGLSAQHPHPAAACAPATLSRNAGEGFSNGAFSTLSRIAGEGTRGRSPRGGERPGGEGVCHAAIFGAAAARAEIAPEDALLGYLQAFAANLVSAGLRLGIIGQTDGQRILSAVEPDIVAAVRAAMTRDPADFGSATFGIDLASMTHETQYTRLFRS
jgi:urease accessory protein